MSAVSVTCRRTLAQAGSRVSGLIVATLFLVVSGAMTAFNLEASEGVHVAFTAVWALSVAQVLPALAAFLAMDVWSDERFSGRIEILLSSPVRERELVVGKFLGVWIECAIAVAFSLVTTLLAVGVFADGLLDGFRVVDLLPAFFALALQAALWCAVAVATSAMFRHAAAAACTAFVLLVAVPRGGWYALLSWVPQGGSKFGEMPIDAHALDLASGLVSTGTVLAYVILTMAFLFVTSKRVSAMRMVGRGARMLLASTAFAVTLALILAGLTIALAVRLDASFDIPVGGDERRFSARTRNILADSRGSVSVTAFLSRKDARFRPLAHFLRSLEREADAAGGARLDLQFVDPRWDLGSAERLVRMGVAEDSLVFERGRRVVSLPIGDGYGERVCASAILRLTMTSQRRTVCWTVGHGESAFDTYGDWGMSNIARDLARDGYRNAALDLAKVESVPADCAVVVVAGAKDDFSRVEASRLDAYLKQGGRMLALVGSAESGGVVSLLPGWGLRPRAPTAGLPARTLSGTDAIVDDFSSHAITEPLKGSRIVLERPVAFEPSAAAETGGGADRVEFNVLAKSGANAYAAIAERGVGAGADLAIRPTRIVAIGDASFAINGQLAARANANRDFFLNCISYLTGVDAAISVDPGWNTLVSGLDRAGRLKLAVALAGVAPALALVLLLALRKRRRS